MCTSERILIVGLFQVVLAGNIPNGRGPGSSINVVTLHQLRNDGIEILEETSRGMRRGILDFNATEEKFDGVRNINYKHNVSKEQNIIYQNTPLIDKLVKHQAAEQKYGNNKFKSSDSTNHKYAADDTDKSRKINKDNDFSHTFHTKHTEMARDNLTRVKNNTGREQQIYDKTNTDNEVIHLGTGIYDSNKEDEQPLNAKIAKSISTSTIKTVVLESRNIFVGGCVSGEVRVEGICIRPH